MKTAVSKLRRCGKGLLITGMALLMAAIFFIAGTNAFVRASVSDRIVTSDTAAGIDADCILVLGAGVRDDNTPSDMLRDRLDTSLSLFEGGVSDRILMSGDHGRADYDEVNVMKSYAVDRGVPSDCVFMDHAGFSTYESLYRAKDVFCAEKIIIVTQGYHLYRALYIAESLGLDAYGVAADRHTYAGQFYRDIREVAARVKDAVICVFHPLPTYLGETIPIDGDGNRTNDDDRYVYSGFVPQVRRRAAL